MPEKIKFYKSNRANKKYKVDFKLGQNWFVVHFGDKRYEQYKDRTPLKLYKDQDHGDKKRREKYLARAKGIKDKNGKLTKDNPLSPNYWAIRYLW